jgi:alanyl-tRNA synthetase
MNATEVRKTFLEYFQAQGHTLVPSSPVIPHGDRTLLFTNAGMNQFKDVFTGREPRKVPRATTAQKCIRAGGKHNDLDNVGYTTRHLTFFEMLGNFSFGDYFKAEAIGYAWELVTRRYGVDSGRLWVTVYKDDAEARELWQKVAGVKSERIVGLGEKDNFWSMGDVGPCGPCSEILVDRGPAFGDSSLENGERFFEIWNLVFMQYDQRQDGSRTALPRPSIDTGMGLERMAMVLQNVDSVFETDLFRRLIGRVEAITGTAYDPGPAGVPHRVLADHIRSLVFAFADGAEPSNEGRGYVLRRILRRAARYGRKIHSGGAILCQLVDDVVREMGHVYPEIADKKEYITRLIRTEEERFGETLDNGIELFDQVVARLKKQGKKTIPGAEVFKLYDTFGFPADLVERMAAEIGYTVDEAGFQRLMEEQKERSRGASQFGVISSAADDLELGKLPETHFIGYESTHGESEVQAVAAGDGIYRVVLASTPFYGESGGQVGDTGQIAGDGFVLRVEDTQKERGRFVHFCRLVEGDLARLRKGAGARSSIDELRRRAIERNHTATHLLHAALRQTLGTHVHQKGSLVVDARLRFDVTHFTGVKPEEIERVESMVRDQVLRNEPVETFETDYADAVQRGAMALFGEKYGDRVRVVRIGQFSMELCGGTHVRRTGEIGPFVVAGESSVSAGVRRLEGLTGAGAEEWHRRDHGIVASLGKLFKVGPEGVLSRVEKLLEENRELRSRPRAPAGGSAGAGEEPVERTQVGSIRFLTGIFPGIDGKELRDAYDRYKQESPELVVALFALAEGKVQTLVAVSPGLVKRGIDAREVLRAGAARIAARGGGRPEMVQAGGTGDRESALGAASEMLAFVRARVGALSS